MSASKTKVLLAIILIIVATPSLILGSTLGVLAHDRNYPGSLSISYDSGDDRFQGSMDTAGLCRRGRLVSVYKVRPGPDRLVGRDRTDRRGEYVVENPRGLTGKFYAVTRVSVRGDGYLHHHRCKGDRSAKLLVAQP